MIKTMAINENTCAICEIYAIKRVSCQTNLAKVVMKIHVGQAVEMSTETQRHEETSMFFC